MSHPTVMLPRIVLVLALAACHVGTQPDPAAPRDPVAPVNPITPLVPAPPASGEALFSAACAGDLAAVQTYARAGVPVNYRSMQNGGFTPLICAARNGYTDVVRFLVDSGANVNARDNSRDKSALLAASFKYHLDIVRYLLAHGADPDAQGINGWTPLHDAGFVGKPDVVKALVAARANLHILNENGETPLGTTRRALTQCQTHSSECGSTQGLTDATLDDYRAVIDFLAAAGG